MTIVVSALVCPQRHRRWRLPAAAAGFSGRLAAARARSAGGIRRVRRRLQQRIRRSRWRPRCSCCGRQPHGGAGVAPGGGARRAAGTGRLRQLGRCVTRTCGYSIALLGVQLPFHASLFYSFTCFSWMLQDRLLLNVYMIAGFDLDSCSLCLHRHPLTLATCVSFVCRPARRAAVAAAGRSVPPFGYRCKRGLWRLGGMGGRQPGKRGTVTIWMLLREGTGSGRSILMIAMHTMQRWYPRACQ